MMNKSFLKTFDEVNKWVGGKDLSTLAFDTETVDLRYGSPIVGISFCNGMDACYINLWNNPEFDKIMNLCLKILSDAKLVIGHNLSYDLRVLRYYGLQM